MGLSQGKDEEKDGKGRREPVETDEPLGPPPKVSVALNRCPFCHDDLSAESAGWVACRKCLARHHRDCWFEAGRCSACGSVERVERSRRKAFVAGLVILLGVSAIVGALLKRRSARPEATPEERATICSWANVTPGTTFTTVSTQRFGGAYPSETETKSTHTLVSKTSSGATVHFQTVDTLRVLPRPANPTAPVQKPRETRLDREAVYEIEHDMRSLLGTITGHTRETIEVPAGRFECDHFSGRTPAHLDRGLKEFHAEVWLASDLPYAVKIVSGNEDCETIAVLTAIKKP